MRRPYSVPDRLCKDESPDFGRFLAVHPGSAGHLKGAGVLSRVSLRSATAGSASPPRPRPGLNARVGENRMSLDSTYAALVPNTP